MSFLSTALLIAEFEFELSVKLDKVSKGISVASLFGKMDLTAGSNKHDNLAVFDSFRRCSNFELQANLSFFITGKLLEDTWRSDATLCLTNGKIERELPPLTTSVKF